MLNFNKKKLRTGILIQCIQHIGQSPKNHDLPANCVLDNHSKSDIKKENTVFYGYSIRNLKALEEEYLCLYILYLSMPLISLSVILEYMHVECVEVFHSVLS